MPGTQLSRRHFSIRVRQDQKRLKKGSQRMIVDCCKDLFNPKLIPIKITFFFIMGATQCIAPFTTLLMKELGFTLKETAIIFTIGSLIPMIAPFLAGIMTNKIANFRTFLIVSVALSGVFSLLYVVIPPARTKLYLPDEDVKFDLGCEKKKFKISYTEPKNCLSPKKSVTLDRINAGRCGHLCDPPALEMNSKGHRIPYNFTLLNHHNETFVFVCESMSPNSSQKCFMKELTPNVTITYADEFVLRNVNFDFPKARRKDRKLTFRLGFYSMTPLDASMFDCQTGKHKSKILMKKYYVDTSGRGESPSGILQRIPCKFHCEGRLKVNFTCINMSQLVVRDVPLSFWLFLVSKIIGSFMLGLTYTLFEAGVVTILREHDYDYGIQRIYGSIGGMIFAPVTGYLIDYFGSGGHYWDYYLCYYFYFVVKIICALILIKLNLRFRELTRNICGNVTEIFTNCESILLIIIVFVSGMCYGFIENFLPWHIRDLGAANWMIGLMTTVAAISAMPFLALSDFFCKRFGHIQCISFGIVCYSIRCFGYSLLKNPYWCFPFEILEGITTGLLVAAAIIYGAKISHQHSLVTFQGMLATSHYGFGKSSGSLLGGFLMSRLGNSVAFQIFGGGSFIIAFIYYLIFKLAIQSKEEQLDRKRREISAMPVQVIPRENLGEGLANTDLKEPREGNMKGHFPITSTPKKSSQYPQEYV